MQHIDAATTPAGDHDVHSLWVGLNTFTPIVDGNVYHLFLRLRRQRAAAARRR